MPPDFLQHVGVVERRNPAMLSQRGIKRAAFPDPSPDQRQLDFRSKNFSRAKQVTDAFALREHAHKNNFERGIGAGWLSLEGSGRGRAIGGDADARFQRPGLGQGTPDKLAGDNNVV